MTTEDYKATFCFCEVKMETDDAILVDIPDYGGEIWVPKHVLHEESEIRQSGDMGELVVKTWFAEWEEL